MNQEQTYDTMEYNFYLSSRLKICKYVSRRGTRCCSWLRYCATSREVVGLIPDGVNGIFH